MKTTIKHYIWVLSALLCVACNGVNRQQAYAVAKTLVEAGAESKVEAENEADPEATVETNVETLAAKAVKDLEMPAARPQSGELLLYRDGYTVSYNTTTLQPNWVAWHLTPNRLKGNVKRNDYPFISDDEVPEPRVETADYRQSGYDRGHMCPAGDNKWSAEAMRQSFLLSNICPQAPNLNRGDWNELEQACRKWAKQYDGVYVVCGPIFYKSKRQRTIGKHRIPVPDAFFKVVLRMGDAPRAIGFLYKNMDGNRPKGDYANTVDEVERITGLDFFPALPNDIERKVEAECNLADWDIKDTF